EIGHLAADREVRARPAEREAGVLRGGITRPGRVEVCRAAERARGDELELVEARHGGVVLRGVAPAFTRSVAPRDRDRAAVIGPRSRAPGDAGGTLLERAVPLNLLLAIGVAGI